MEEILLHICCGVCASSVVQRLREENFDVVGFFYNPNIHPEGEYQQRLAVMNEVARILNLELIPGPYEPDNWFKLIKGLENEPEGSRRCAVCFRMRLEEACNKAKEMNISKFTTTLTVSPHKDSAVINEIGKAIDSSGFLARDFKKQGGFGLAMKFAKRYNLYRQNYCGCIYSQKDAK